MKTRVAAVLAVLVCGNPTWASAEPADPAKSVEAVRQALAGLQTQIDKLASAIAEREKAKETAAASSLAEVAELRAEISAIRQGMTEQRKAVDQAQADAQRLGEASKGLQAKLDQATKERDEAAKARDEATKALAAATKASGATTKVSDETAKARSEASASMKTAEARAQEIERLKADLAESRQRIGELERQAAALAAAKVPDLPASGAPTVAKAETAPAAGAVAERPASSPGTSPAVGGIKQWRQPDGTLFFGDNPPVAGSKLITVIGGAPPTAPSDAPATTGAP